MGQGYLFIFAILIAFAPLASAAPVLEGQAFACENLTGRQTRTRIYHGSFVHEFRGQPLEINYISNRKRLLKGKDLVAVAPGFNKGSFHEMVEAIGVRGDQAVSLDLTNINGTGPFLAPTPEEDAELLHALLTHLGFTKKTFRKKIFIVNHSRGSLVTSRFVLGHYKSYRIAGIIKFNPYVGWIPDYHAQSHGAAMSSGFKMVHALMENIPGVNLATGMAASFAEGAGTQLALSAVRMFVNVHDRAAAYRALRDELGEEDEEVLENLRQKLIGMENAEILEDFQLMQDLGIPVMIVRSDNDKLVPAGQIDSVADSFGFPVVVFGGSGHMLPYDRTDESADVVAQALFNLRKNRAIDRGILPQ